MTLSRKRSKTHVLCIIFLCSLPVCARLCFQSRTFAHFEIVVVNAGSSSTHRISCIASLRVTRDESSWREGRFRNEERIPIIVLSCNAEIGNFEIYTVIYP